MRGFPADIPKIKDIALLSEGRNIISTDRKSCFGRQLVPATGMINVVTEMAINRHLPPIAKKTRRGAEHFRSIADKCRSGNCLPPFGNCLPPSGNCLPPFGNCLPPFGNCPLPSGKPPLPFGNRPLPFGNQPPVFDCDFP